MFLPIKKLLGILLLIVGCLSGALGQFEIERKGIEFTESNTIYKFDINLPYQLASDLVTRVKDDSGDFADGTLQGNPDYELAGLVFIPIWDTTMVSSNEATFTTIGYRVCVALWKTETECGNPTYDAMILAGFGNINTALEPVSANYANRLNNYTIELTGSTVYNGVNLVRTSNYTTQEVQSMQALTRESDFVFIDIDKFEDLANSDIYFPNGQGPSTGLNIERAEVSVDLNVASATSGTSANSTTGIPNLAFERRGFRTLSFRPDPVPSLQNVPSKAAIAFYEGPRCPPFWDEGDDLSAIDSAITRSFALMYECAPIEFEREVCFSLHYGGSSPTNSSSFASKGGSVLEFNLEFGLSPNFSIEGLAGSYPHENPDGRKIKALGFSLLLRYYIPLANINPGSPAGSSLFLTAGPGAFSLDNRIEGGLSAGLGIRQRIAPQLYAEVAGLYQGLDYLTNSSGSKTDLLSFKAGIIYCLNN